MKTYKFELDVIAQCDLNYKEHLENVLLNILEEDTEYVFNKHISIFPEGIDGDKEDEYILLSLISKNNEVIFDCKSKKRNHNTPLSLYNIDIGTLKGLTLSVIKGLKDNKEISVFKTTGIIQ